MKIAGYIQHEIYKITIFDYGARFVVKFENGPLEISYKLPKEEFSGFQEIESNLSKQFYEKVDKIFEQLADSAVDFFNS